MLRNDPINFSDPTGLEPGAEAPDICDELLDAMNKIIDGDPEIREPGLIARFRQQLRASPKTGPGTDGWKGHEEQIVNRQRQLEKKLEDWDANNCGPRPPRAVEWQKKPFPTEEDWQAYRNRGRLRSWFIDSFLDQRNILRTILNIQIANSPRRAPKERITVVLVP
jgi:hypothetical protein